MDWAEMRFPVFSGSYLTNPTETGMAWFEWPLLTYFMLHFFPPLPGVIGSLCLLLSLLGLILECRKCSCPQVAQLSHRLILSWLLLLALLALSLFQVPAELLGESRHRLSSDLLKGTFFALIVFLYLKSADRARRLLVAGALACFLMFLHSVFSTAQGVMSTGKLPFQRDYLFWMLTFFPFALAGYVAQPRRPWLVFVAAVGASGAMVLAVTTGFRGATLALLLMSLVFAVLARMWRLLMLGAVLVVLGVIMLYLWFPEQAAYVLGKFQQTHASNRWGGHWLPAWDMSMQAPWLGHGFGHLVFRHHYGLGIPGHAEWTPAFSEQLGWLPSAPHSIFFETLFAAGWPGVFALFWLTFVMIRSLLPPVWQQRKALVGDPWLLLALTVLVSFIGNYVFFYQFETPAWRSLPILVAVAAACSVALGRQLTDKQANHAL